MTFNAMDYVETILTDDSFASKYKAEENSLGHDGAERLGQLRNMVKSMLDFAAKAQIQFERNVDHLANAMLTSSDSSSPYYYNPSDVTASTIGNTGASDMKTGLSDLGLSYKGTRILYLSGTSLRHYFKIEDEEKFNKIKTVKFNNKTVSYSTKGEEIYFEKAYDDDDDLIARSTFDDRIFMHVVNEVHLQAVENIVLEDDSDPEGTEPLVYTGLADILAVQAEKETNSIGLNFYATTVTINRNLMIEKIHVAYDVAQ